MILRTSWLFTLSSAFLLFGFLLVEWVVQLCQWHLSRSCVETSPPYFSLAQWCLCVPTVGAQLGQLKLAVAPASSRPQSPCSVLVSSHCCVGRQKSRPFKEEGCILWRKTDVQTREANRKLERETDGQMAKKGSYRQLHCQRMDNRGR